MQELRRALSLPLVVLYGLGVTIGAGIYVLLGATAEKAGMHAPLAFVLAAVVIGFSAASYAELAVRFPVSAGEAAYVRAGLRSNFMATTVGFLVILSGLVSSATIAVGSSGYLREFLDVPDWALIVAVVLLVGAIAAWGIVESVAVAGFFTLIEVGALLVIIVAGFVADPGLVRKMPAVMPPLADGAAWLGVAGAGLLAFFAVIGFEDIVNLAEETKDPERNLPRAILLTLLVTTVIYFLVAAVAVLAVPVGELAEARAPLSLLFERLTGFSPVAVSLVAVTATLNGVVIQMIMASRVLYGMARQGSVPAFLGFVHPVTRTPLAATAAVVGVVLTLSLAFPLEGLAEATSQVVLVIFGIENAALLALKIRGAPAPQGAFTVGTWVPVLGLLTCALLFAAGLFT